MTQDQKKEVLARHVKGESAEDIAIALALPIAEVQTAIPQKHEAAVAPVAPAAGADHARAELRQRAKARSAAGNTDSEVAKELGISVESLRALIEPGGNQIIELPGGATATMHGTGDLASMTIHIRDVRPIDSLRGSKRRL